VVIRNLCYSHRDKVVFKGIDLAIARGQITAIMGPSGSGKTTLLRLMSGQVKPDAGQIKVNDIDITQLSRRGLNKLRRQIGMLFQQGALFTDLNVYENVAFLLREHTNLPDDMIRDL